MAIWYGYVGAERLNLTNPQAQTLLGGFEQLGTSPNDNQPSARIHWRRSLDNSKVIFIAKFNTANLSEDSVKNRLATIFSVDAEDIDAVNNPQIFDSLSSPVFTFSYLASARFRVVLFGDLGASFLQSNLEALAYMAANSAEWETDG